MAAWGLEIPSRIISADNTTEKGKEKEKEKARVQKGVERRVKQKGTYIIRKVEDGRVDGGSVL